MASASPHTLGIDIGGSFIKTGMVDPSRGTLIGAVSRVPTPRSGPDSFIGALRSLLGSPAHNARIGVGFPGVVRQGLISTAPHLSADWIGVNAAELFGKGFDATATVLNDADAAGLAEMAFGVGQTDLSLKNGTTILITFGTGIGTALFVRGQLVPNTEFGHLYLSDGVEGEATAAASIRVRENLGWIEWAARVNRYLAEIDKLLNPDRIIFGGGIVENYPQFGASLRSRAKILPAQLGNSAGLIGAALATIM